MSTTATLTPSRRIGFFLFLGVAILASACVTTQEEQVESDASSLDETTEATASSEMPHVMAPDEGDVLWFAHESPDNLGSGGELRIFLDHATHPNAGGSFAKFTLGVGGALPVHRHDKTEEVGYIIEGEGIVVGIDDSGDEVEMQLAAGYVWYNRPGAWHAVRNVGDVPLELVFATIPNEEQGLLSYFREIGVAPGNVAPVIAAEELAQLAASHDMIVRPR